jgi:SAM-dependent methyltransferase
MFAESLVAVRCAVCGSARHEIVCSASEIRAQIGYLRWFHRRRLRGDAPASALADRAEFTQDYATDLVACTGCELLYRSPRPSDEAIRQAYALDRYGQERLESLFQSQLAFFRPRARALARWLPPGARVVEVGSFVGGFLAAGRERGWAMLGVDPGQEVDEFSRQRGLDVFRGMLSEAPLGPGEVDCVAVWNTFDQLPDPEPTLEAARRLLRPGGLLALRVPNGECYRRSLPWMRRLSSPLAGWLRAALAWNNLLAFPYVNGYTVECLDRLLVRHRLERISVRPDTLPRLSDAQSKRWAVGEEIALKWFGRLVARLDAALPESRLSLAPWFEAYYRPVEAACSVSGP